MKKLLLKLKLIIILFSPITLFGQEATKATISHDMHIVIDDKKPLTNAYHADISCFAFDSEYQAEQFFNFFTTNLISYIIDYKNGKVTVVLHPEYLRLENWGLIEWQKYLDEKYEYDRNNVKLLNK